MSPAHASTNNISALCAQYPVARSQSGPTPAPRHWYTIASNVLSHKWKGGVHGGGGFSRGCTPPDVPPVASASDFHAVVAR